MSQAAREKFFCTLLWFLSGKFYFSYAWCSYPNLRIYGITTFEGSIIRLLVCNNDNNNPTANLAE